MPTNKTKEKAARKANEEPYARYGKQWEKAAMKLTKPKLIELWRDAIIDNHALRGNANISKVLDTLHDIEQKADLILSANSLLQELDAKKEEQGKWVPKNGDWITRTDRVSDWPKGKIVQARNVGNVSVTIDNDGKTEVWSLTPSLTWVRPATQAEIDAHLESSAYGEREGLEEGMACEMFRHEKMEVAYLLRDHPQLMGPFEEGNGLGLRYQDGVVRDTGIAGWNERNEWKIKIIPFPVFKKLLIKTIEKLRAAREEEEAKKPIPFGQHVQVVVNYLPMSYRVACDEPSKEGLYRLVPVGPLNERGNMHLKRSEFTVLNN